VNRLAATLDLAEKRLAKPGALSFVELCGVVELALGERVEETITSNGRVHREVRRPPNGRNPQRCPTQRRSALLLPPRTWRFLRRRVLRGFAAAARPGAPDRAPQA